MDFSSVSDPEVSFTLTARPMHLAFHCRDIRLVTESAFKAPIY